MIAFFLACYLYLAAHAAIGTALDTGPPPASCATDTDCGCVDDCLGPAP